MQVSNSVLSSWAFNCGFKDHNNGVFRGRVNTSHKDSVTKGLTNMGLTLVSVTNTGTEIWASEDDAQVVLVKYI